MSGVPNAATNLISWGLPSSIPWRVPHSALFEKSIALSKLTLFSSSFQFVPAIWCDARAIIKIRFTGLLHIERAPLPWHSLAGRRDWNDNLTIILLCFVAAISDSLHFSQNRLSKERKNNWISYFFREVMSFLDFSASPCINFRRRLKRNCVPKCNSILPPAKNRFAVNKLEASPSKQVESLFFN